MHVDSYEIKIARFFGGHSIRQFDKWKSMMLINNDYRTNRPTVIGVDSHDYLQWVAYMTSTSFSTFTRQRILNTFSPSPIFGDFI